MPERRKVYEGDPLFESGPVHFFYVAVSISALEFKPGHTGRLTRRLRELQTQWNEDATVGLIFECKCPLPRRANGREHCDWERSWEYLYSSPETRVPGSERYHVNRSMLANLEMWARYPINKMARQPSLQWLKEIRGAHLERSRRPA